jgi:flagellar motor switch protein FliG
MILGPLANAATNSVDVPDKQAESGPPVRTILIDTDSRSFEKKMPKFAHQFRSLAHIEPGILLLAIGEQRPATIALVLSHLPKCLAVQVAGKLAADLRRRVLLCLADQQYCGEEVTRDVLEEIAQRIRETERCGGPAKAASILQCCDPAVETSLLRSLDQQDAGLSRQIRTTLLGFDDLVWLDERRMQTLLKNVDLRTWAIALKRSQTAIRRKIVRNMSSRAADQLRDEFDYLGLVSDGEIERARQRVVRVARRLQRQAAAAA